MQMQEVMQFAISKDKVVCNTPQGGIDVSDFLQIMRKSLDLYRQNKNTLSCTPQKTNTDPLSALDSCTS